MSFYSIFYADFVGQRELKFSLLYLGTLSHIFYKRIFIDATIYNKNYVFDNPHFIFL